MKTTTTLILAFLFAVAVSAQERFYYTTPYEGMQGDVERVSVKAYLVDFVDNKPVVNKRFSRTEISKFDENGLVYEKKLSVYAAFISMESKTTYEYEGKELQKRVLQRYAEGEKSILVLKCVERDDNGAVFENQTSIGKADTTYIRYDYDEQSMTSMSTKDMRTGSKFVTYYQDNREVKTEAYENGQLRSSQVKFYDPKDHNLAKMVVTQGDQTYTTEFKYTKFDDKGNWIEGKMTEDGLLRSVITRSIFYR